MRTDKIQIPTDRRTYEKAVNDTLSAQDEHRHTITTQHNKDCKGLVTKMYTTVKFVDPLWCLQSIFLDQELATQGRIFWEPRTRINAAGKRIYEEVVDGDW